MEEIDVVNGQNYDLAASTSEKLETSRGYTLEESFRNIVEGNPIEFELDNINTILKKDLQVNLVCLKPKLKKVIPYMLLHFIKSWPGWQKNGNYLKKQISFNNWFVKFKEYLLFKINYLIKNDYDKLSHLIKPNYLMDDIPLIDNSTQTSVPCEKPVAPYSIEIQGIPKILNSLIFCEGPEESIIAKKYSVSPFSDKLSMKQLLNWPYIEIEFFSKELHFKRKNMHEFKRFLMLSNEKITFQKIETLVEEITLVDEKLNRRAYTINALREYCATYVKILKRHQNIMEISAEYISDIEHIFEEFLTDIEELNMGSMATNTSVIFNMGNFIYARNKSVRTGGQAVSFAESITPKMNVVLFYFNGLHDTDSDIPFQGLQKVLDSKDKNVIRGILPILQFTCTYCNEHYADRPSILSHFKENHCMEQPVLCFKCKTQMNVAVICAARWSHQCDGKNSAGRPMTN